MKFDATDRLFRLDANALAQARASEVLAIAPGAIGRVFSLSAGPPKTRSVAAAPAAQASTNVALVSVEGPLAQRADYFCGYVDGYDAVASRVVGALEDQGVDAVVLVIDSPGGDVAGLEEAVRRMTAARVASGKPVLAFADEFAASAAYWLAAGVADGGVYLPPSGGVGSIGTLAVHSEQSARLEQKGIAVTVFRDPAGKAAGLPVEELSDVARERMQSMVSEATTRFVSAMASARGITSSAVRGLDAAVLYGQAAVDAGLADGIDSLEGVIKRAADKAAQGKAQMNVTQALAAVLNAPPTATAEELVESAPAATPLFQLGRAVLAVTGESDPGKASAKVAEWKAASARESERVAKDAAEALEREKTERVSLLKSMSAAGQMPPGSIKKGEGEIAQGNIAEPFASMPLDILRGIASALPKSPRVEVKAADAGGLSADEIAKCKEKGVDPEIYAQNKAAFLAAGGKV